MVPVITLQSTMLSLRQSVTVARASGIRWEASKIPTIVNLANVKNEMMLIPSLRDELSVKEGNKNENSPEVTGVDENQNKKRIK